MTAVLSASIAAAVRAHLRSVDGAGTSELNVDAAANIDLANGTGDDQADLIFHDQRTLAASATENLDLAGVLTDPFGNAITFATVKAIVLRAAAGNTNDVIMGGAASAAFVGPFGDATDTVAVRPGGALVLAAPADGWTVTATTADILKAANSSSGTGVTYDITIIGTSS